MPRQASVACSSISIPRRTQRAGSAGERTAFRRTISSTAHRSATSRSRRSSEPRPRPFQARLAAAAIELSAIEGGERYLADALAGEATDPYAFVFLDCPPAFGALTVNALAAADRVIVPVQAEYYALEGLSQLLGSINLVKARLNPRLAVAGILVTMVDARTRLAAEVEQRVAPPFGALVFTTSVPRSVRLAEAPSHGVPAIAYDRRSSGARGVLEGGDGACRPFLRAAAAWAVAWKCLSAEPA